MEQVKAEPVELKPCPFCGGGADFGARPNERAWWSLHCDQCTAYAVGATEAEAIAAWNQRANPQPATVDGLAEALKGVGHGHILTSGGGLNVDALLTILAELKSRLPLIEGDR